MARRASRMSCESAPFVAEKQPEKKTVDNILKDKMKAYMNLELAGISDSDMPMVRCRGRTQHSGATVRGLHRVAGFAGSDASGDVHTQLGVWLSATTPTDVALSRCGTCHAGRGPAAH